MRHSLILSRNEETIAFLRQRYLGEEWYVTNLPATAIQALEREPFDRCFLDYWLDQEPRNGRDVTQYLGKHPECNPLMKIILTTEDATKAKKMLDDCKRQDAHHIPASLIKELGA